MNNFNIVCKMLKEGEDYFTSMQLLHEEATTVVREDNFQFMIYPEPLGNPSFHVRYKDEWEVVLELLSFKILESKFGPYKKGTTLPSKIQKKIIEILKDKNELNVIVWEYLIHTWNLNNPRYIVNIKTKIPSLGEI